MNRRVGAVDSTLAGGFARWHSIYWSKTQRWSTDRVQPGFKADVGVQSGKIAAIGRINEKADQTIDAEGHVVAPGFVDGHTHMDAQIFWDQLGSCSCYHGVTSVVMGNCGFTIAPCREA